MPDYPESFRDWHDRKVIVMRENDNINVDKGDALANRLLDFAVSIIKLVNKLPNTQIGKHVGGQILRSGTSPGSNYEEARGAESRADFIHKLGIVLKELKETRFWLKVILRSEILTSQNLITVLSECEELTAIIAKSIFTAKNKRRK